MAKRYGWNGKDGLPQPERFYGPLCFACMGVEPCPTHGGVGTPPWIPTPEELKLSVWENANPDIDYEQLAKNFEMIDAHDGTPGRGISVPKLYDPLEVFDVSAVTEPIDPIISVHFDVDLNHRDYGRQVKDGLLRANGLRPGQPEEEIHYGRPGARGNTIRCDDDRLHQLLSGRAKPLQSDFTVQGFAMLERTGLRSTADMPLRYGQWPNC